MSSIEGLLVPNNYDIYYQSLNGVSNFINIGNTGPTGSTGAQGASQAASGPTGVTGPAGPTGIGTSYPGSTGPTGPIGPNNLNSTTLQAITRKYSSYTSTVTQSSSAAVVIASFVPSSIIPNSSSCYINASVTGTWSNGVTTTGITSRIFLIGFNVGASGLPNTAPGASTVTRYSAQSVAPSFGVNVINNGSVVQITAGDSSANIITWVVSYDITYTQYPAS